MIRFVDWRSNKFLLFNPHFSLSLYRHLMEIYWGVRLHNISGVIPWSSCPIFPHSRVQVWNVVIMSKLNLLILKLKVLVFLQNSESTTTHMINNVVQRARVFQLRTKYRHLKSGTAMKASSIFSSMSTDILRISAIAT